MSKQVKKKVIGLVAGLAIIGGGVATAVVLANLANRNIKSFIVNYDKLLEIRNRILSNYSKNASVDNQCTVDEFANKVNDGTLKTWINDNFKEYFKGTDSDTTFDFNLKIEETDNEILLTLTPTENKSLRLDKFSDKYDTSIVEFNKNSIIFKFPKSEFLKQQLFSHEQLNLFQSKLIADMQKNKLTFENLQTISDSEQKTQIIDWVSNSLGIKNIFSEIDFQKLPATNDTYSIILTPNNNYIFGWVNNENDTTDFIIERKSITINFNKIIKIENNDLIQLKEEVNIYLQQRNINYLTWLEHFENKDKEYQNLMSFIYQKLQLLINTLPNDCIDSLEILSNSNDIYSLKIIPSSGYSFLSNSDYYDNGNIILIDIDIYSYIEFNGIDLDSFYTQLQLSIDAQKYSKEQFNQWIITTEFKDYVGANLKIANGNKIEITKIKSISYDEINNELKIIPNNAYRFRLLDNSANATVNSEGELIISNLKLFEYINFTDLQSLYTGMQDYIDNIKWTSDEFSEYVLDSKNFDSLKTLISNYLYVSTTQKIDTNKITNISFANGNLIIFLDSDYTIYKAIPYVNVSLSTNTLTIKNLKYFKVVDLVKLDTLFNAVQSLIDAKKYTIEELKEYVTNNQDNFKSLIANNLFINEQDKLLISEVINVSFETNNDIRISLNNNYTKYNLETNQNFELDGTDLIIKNLKYYTAIEFNALNNLFDAIQDSIKNKKFTKNEFDNFSINNNEELKELIADNLYISDSEKLNVTDIISATFTIATNELNIVLNNNYLKYSASLDSNIALTDDTLTVRNLKYYNAISFVDIQQLFSAIQNYITTNQYTPDEFKEFSNVQGKETIKQLISINLLISSSSKLDIDNIIDVNVNDNYQLKISLNNDYKKYSMTENDNVTLENDVLTIDNLVYYSTTNISNLAAVFDYLQEIVLTNQYTPDEFRTYLNANMDTIKNDIASKILISETEAINVSEIINISLNSSNKFEIRLDSVNKKYTIEEYENASLTGTTILINNLEFYTSIKFSNLSNLRSKIQDIISKRGYTESDFRNYISNNKTEFKNYISNHLTKSVSGPGSWNINQISNVEYSSGSVKVTFDIPTNYKYSFESYSNATFVNNVLEIKSYSFYSPTSTSYFTWSGNTITGLTSSGQSQTSLAIPTNCTEIGRYAFRNNKNLRSVIIPWSVKVVGFGAFEFCSNLNSLTLKEGVQEIGQWTFRLCTSLTSVTFPDSIVNIKEHAFYECSGLTNFFINQETSQLKFFGEWAFGNCTNLNTITIPKSCIEIQANTFGYSTKLNNVHIYSTNITMYDYAFTFDSYWGIANIYFYNLTNTSNLSLRTNSFHYSNPTTLYVYVRNTSVKNAIISVLRQHSPANYVVNIF